MIGRRARLAEGEPGLQGSRVGVFEPFHWARRDAKPARLPLSVTASAVTPSPPGKDAGLVAPGRGSPAVAPLPPVSRVPFQGQEASTSCEGRRRVRLLLRTRGGCAKPNHVCSVSLHQRPRRRSQSPPFRAQRGRPPASGQQAQPLKPLQAAPARKPIASRSRRFRPQAKRGGIRGQPWRWLKLAVPGRPLVLSRERERTAHARAAGRRVSAFRGNGSPHARARQTRQGPRPPGQENLLFRLAKCRPMLYNASIGHEGPGRFPCHQRAHGGCKVRGRHPVHPSPEPRPIPAASSP